ncbi:MAG: family 20 glycosylhydrolase [Clostridia bacterium]|nr:family 20 glycosylhydrolase [Clostridia bacterium]
MFEYRGFMLDSVRHMQTIEEIKKLIDAIALLGFNKFHWHLTDDQGWRFECRSFPELNSVAAVRPYSDFGKTYVDEPYGRVYTKAEMREVVTYCTQKGIDVVPEFDMPGHSSALLSALPELSCAGKDVQIKTHQGIFKEVLCPAKEKTFETVIRIIDEFLEIFPGEYFHIGGDEAPSNHWKNCPDCQRQMKSLGVKNYAEYQNCFMNKIIDYLESKGRHCIVWNEAANGKNLDKRAIVQYWKENPKPTVRFINSGGKAILSPFSYFYLDYDYSIIPLNRVYSLKNSLPGLTQESKANIIGVEAPIWTEYIDNNDRLEELLFPRLFAVSKVASGENHKPYREFLTEVQNLKNQFGSFNLADEKMWTKPRTAMLFGWLEFVKNHYTIDFIKEQLF